MSERWQELDRERLAQFYAAYLDDPAGTAPLCCDWLEDQGGVTLADVLLLFHAGRVGMEVVADWCERAGDANRAALVRAASPTYRADGGYEGVGDRLLVLRLFPDVPVTIKVGFCEYTLARMSDVEATTWMRRQWQACGFRFDLPHDTYRDADARQQWAIQTLPASELYVAGNDESSARVRTAPRGRTRTWHIDPYRGSYT